MLILGNVTIWNRKKKPCELQCDYITPRAMYWSVELVIQRRWARFNVTQVRQVYFISGRCERYIHVCKQRAVSFVVQQPVILPHFPFRCSWLRNTTSPSVLMISITVIINTRSKSCLHDTLGSPRCEMEHTGTHTAASYWTCFCRP